MERKPAVGQVTTLEKMVRVILAPNPSPMTYWGTNTYILGQRKLTIVDPGPEDDAHLNAILAAVGAGQEIAQILVTHAHKDHSPLSRRLSEISEAPILAFGDAQAGRSEIMQTLAADGFMGGGEGVDTAFVPDHTLAHGDVIRVDDMQAEVLHTPGHFGNHVALAMGDICFTGDLVMGWASSLVSPPDGDLGDFMRSCRLLASRRWRCFYAGHGAPIAHPGARLDWLISHRLTREAEIRAALAATPANATTLAKRIYQDIDPMLITAAARNVFAHLIDLSQRGLAECEQTIGFDSVFQPTKK